MIDAAMPKGPLSGLLVLDLTRVLAGPYCTLNLADLGARVIKIEMPVTGDDSRQIGPFVGDGEGRTSAYFASVNRNKESIALDLKNPEDRVIFEGWLARADVLVENFTPGTMSRLGYGWEDIHRRFPALVMASISGFGQTGPSRELPAYDMVVQAMGGVLSLTGEEDGPPTRVGVSIGDLAAGLFGVIGIQAALLDRVGTGIGRHVDVAMLDSQVSLLENALARFQIDGQVPRPIGSRHPSITPFGVFKAADGYMVAAAGNDKMFLRLCATLGLEGLIADPLYSSNSSRCTNHEALKKIIEGVLALATVAHWLALLRGQGIPCGPMNDVAAVMADPQVNARDMLPDLPLPRGLSMKVARSPVRFSGAALQPVLQAPELDQHRAALLAELELSVAPRQFPLSRTKETT
ncbi:CaiB/BaiF CoA-transferase family protein [Variovorax sp. EL159]|uniref:CaiB/BaiF CoA transferase family protein n=1 Tax=Variovorax sp. EL159 TaxID=1566270 RepID=UPI0008852C6C|nr:CoA transferase [Variovorax sp. EL159]SCX72565.1 CoA:oxalate CoA-transferase [Variovorax sp. EL159]